MDEINEMEIVSSQSLTQQFQFHVWLPDFG